MRREDRQKLELAYGEGDGSEVDYRLARRLGVFVEAAIALERDVWGDLDEDKFGIGWWAPHPGTKRRILISDYLWQLCHSIQQNMTEAGLHLLEARGAWEEQARRISKGLHFEHDEPRFEMPSIGAPIDELAGELFRLHVGGFMRAIGSTFDCVGGVLVAVAGLKTDLLRADLITAERAIAKLTGANDGERLQISARDAVRRSIAAAGPPGWDRWADHYRNMLVHRGRRTQKGGGDIIASSILDAKGDRIPRLRSFPLLPRDPVRSEVEVMLHLGTHDHLTEHGLVTMDGVLRSTLAFVTAASQELLDVWRTRRASPAMIEQPREQWKDVKPAEQPFGGYADGTVGTNFKQVHVSPSAVRRLRAAALTTDRRHLWDDTFD